MCQIQEILDSQCEDFLGLTAEAVSQFHPNRQAKLTQCAGGKASAMRDFADLPANGSFREFFRPAIFVRCNGQADFFNFFNLFGNGGGP